MAAAVTLAGQFLPLASTAPCASYYAEDDANEARILRGKGFQLLPYELRCMQFC